MLLPFNEALPQYTNFESFLLHTREGTILKQCHYGMKLFFASYRRPYA